MLLLCGKIPSQRSGTIPRQVHHRYREQLGKLIETLNTPEHRAEAIDVVRSLVEKIVLTLDESENRLVADLHGNLAGILTLAAGSKPDTHINDTTLAASKAALGVDQTCESAPEGAGTLRGGSLHPTREHLFGDLSRVATPHHFATLDDGRSGHAVDADGGDDEAPASPEDVVRGLFGQLLNNARNDDDDGSDEPTDGDDEEGDAPN